MYLGQDRLDFFAGSGGLPIDIIIADPPLLYWENYILAE